MALASEGGGGGGSPHSEQTPLLQRAVSPRTDAEQFRALQQEAQQEATQAATTSTAWLYIIVALVVGSFWVVNLYIEIRTWFVIFLTINIPCEQPLWLWLLVMANIKLRFCATNSRRAETEEELLWIHREQQCLLLLTMLWLGIGNHWSHNSQSCRDANPALWYWVRTVVVWNMIFTFIFVVLPCIITFLSVIVLMMMNRGWIRNPKAAREDTIQLLGTVAYNPELFAPEASGPADDRPARECCCCAEEFGPDLPIVQTPCGHYFHQDCLGSWLKLAKTCPICRMDLDDKLHSAIVTEV